MTDVPAGPMPEHPVPEQRTLPDNPSVIGLLLDLQQQIARVEGAQIVMVGQMASAEESRRIIYQKIEAVSDKAVEAAHRAEVAVTQAVKAGEATAAMKPGVDDYLMMKGYARFGLAALGLVIMPLLGVLGYFAVQLWHYIVAHVDLTRLWKS